MKKSIFLLPVIVLLSWIPQLANAIIYTYTDETSYLNAISLLECRTIYESFENDTTWGSARHPDTLPEGTSQGITWTSNNSTSEITTGSGPALTGLWGFFSLPHGNFNTHNPPAIDCTVPGNCGDGFRGTGLQTLFGIGGWLQSNTQQAKIDLIIDGITVDFGNLCDIDDCIITSTPRFFGVINTNGFTSFQINETEGTIGDVEYIFADDFTFCSCISIIQDILNLVIWYYQSILDREPELGGAEGWTAEIERIVSLGIDVKEGFIALGKLFFNSEEYIDMGNTDEAYIVDLYETFLHRTPSGIGLEVGEVDDWEAELTGGLTRNLLLNYFIFAEEFRTYMEQLFGICPIGPEYALVNDLYRGFLARLPENDGFNSWLALMQEAQCTGVQAVRDLTNQIGLDFIHSPEYMTRNPEFLDPPDNQIKNPDFSSEFVTNLYDAVLRRGAELAGYLAWKEQYDSDTLTKEEILQFFVDSVEFQTRVQEVIDAGCSLWPEISLQLLYSGFTNPVHVANAGDGSNRLFVVEQPGEIIIINGDSIIPTPFLNITSKVLFGGERGLLSVAFPPDYSTKGYFYVSYTRKPDGASVVSRFRTDPDNADLALALSEEIILTVNQPYSNHNGGQIAFGPDNFLYIGFGDGGSGGDPDGNGQNTSTLLGKILRIDVESGNSPYSVPDTNPFVGQAGYSPEIWALGLRNPWRFSFDRQNGDLYIADVGQNSWEEIDFQTHTSSGGENYGWNIMEGAHCFDATSCDQSNLILPVYEYDHTQGFSITGGFVYRGTQFGRMQGIYYFGDYVNGKVWGLQIINEEWKSRLLLDTAVNISSFGESEDGKLLIIDINGNIYEIQET
jgi:glucose/arabinose dehydrogenase